MKKILNYILYVLAAGALKMLGLFPRRLLYASTPFLARLVYILCPRWRNIIFTNLRIAMPQISTTQAKAIALKTFSNIGRVAIGLGRIQQLRNKTKEHLTHLFDISQEIQTTIYRLLSHGKGVLFLTGHFGVWELLPNIHAITFPDIPLSIVVRPLDYAPLDRLINRFRTCLGNRILPKKNSIRDILGALHRGEAIGILLDQNVCREEGVFVDFFGKEACTNFGLAAIALRTQTPILPVCLFYDEAAKIHRVHMEPEIPLVRTGNKAQDLKLNTAAYTKALETMIRKFPDQWLWVHRRWKTRPSDLDEKVYATRNLWGSSSSCHSRVL